MKDGRSSACKSCVRRYQAMNKERIRKKAKEYYDANAEERRAHARQKYHEQSDRNKEQSLKRYYANIDRERARSVEWRQQHPAYAAEKSAEWRRNNPDQVLAHNNKRRAAKLQAIPAWCECDVIAAIYAECRCISDATGIVHHVDHIIPLQHPLVCGLHCAANLQIITEEENRRKHNHFVP